ncbi:MAG: LacI family DNA-binding transcriptional regulator [Lentisphaeria bacterium]|nr:LacI family DNA-binding transcriptional regulator [Lentisphaeria bacterium]
MREDYNTLRRYGVSGFICCSHNYPELKNEVVELFSGAKDVVVLEKPYAPKMPYIRTSRLKALTAMIADARKLGYRKIGILHGLKTELTEQTLYEEFLQAMAENGLKADEKLIFEAPKSIDMPQTRIDAAIENVILPFRPDLFFVDDAISAVVLSNRLLKIGLNVAICGGNNDPLFQSVDVKSFDPGYEKMASELMNLLLHPEKRGEVPVIEAVYKEGSIL